MKNFVKTSMYSVSAATIFMLLLECARYGKINYIVGSSAAFFSLKHCLTPLLGIAPHFMGFATVIFCIRALFYSGITIPTLLVYHIPSVFGAFTFSRINSHAKTTRFKNYSIAALLALCATLFILHPVGYHAAAYTTLWLIPTVLLFLPTNNAFVHALTSTFVTHAVGSVIWLYLFTSLTPVEWIALMPIALIERIIFASGTTICYYSMHVLYRWITQTGIRVQKKATTITQSL